MLIFTNQTLIKYHVNKTPDYTSIFFILVAKLLMTSFTSFVFNILDQTLLYTLFHEAQSTFSVKLSIELNIGKRMNKGFPASDFSQVRFPFRISLKKY